MLKCLVALQNTTLGFDKLYSYALSDAFGESVEVGSRVLVPFGRSNALRQGVVFDITEQTENEKLKSVLSVLDKYPVYTKEMTALASVLSERLFCTKYDVLHAMIPTGLNMKPVTEFVSAGKTPDGSLSPEAKEVLEFISGKKSVNYINLSSHFGPDILDDALKLLSEKEYILRNDFLKRVIGDKSLKTVRALQTDAKMTLKQKSVYDFLVENGEVNLKELLYYTACGKGVVDNLEKSGAVEICETECFRNPYEGAEITEKLSDITLTDEQEKVYSSLKESLDGNCYDKVLLHGITGSGKTLVYLKLIQYAVENNKTALMLVPEIALTPQTVRRLKGLFGDRVAVLHSGLTLSGRTDEWKRIMENKADIVIGTRSAIFAPLRNLGLIVIDECHESTYQSDCNPRYDANEVAFLRGRYNNALVLQSSATPTVKSYYDAVSRNRLYKLKNRYSSAVLPEVFVVDMKEERERRGKIISASLCEELHYNLQNKKQSILLLNRRGFNSSLTCVSCGNTVKCGFCSVPMTYHKANGHLMCHYCGRMMTPPEVCPVCGNNYLRFDGFGTQSLESELKELFPDASVLRMDLDTTMRSMSHEQYLKDFGDGKYDILIGTQMIAKGLDFPNVTLVGVLSADSMLVSTRWQNTERAFSLLTQVVGRSGRGSEKGRAFIQTYMPDNPILKYAADQDYESFYNEEIRGRKMMLYPPFCDIWSVVFSSESEINAEKAARYFMGIMEKKAKSYPDLPLRVLGPSVPSVGKLSGKYRRTVTIKCRRSSKMNSFYKEVLCDFYNERCFSDVSIATDTNGE